MNQRSKNVPASISYDADGPEGGGGGDDRLLALVYAAVNLAAGQPVTVTTRSPGMAPSETMHQPTAKLHKIARRAVDALNQLAEELDMTEDFADDGDEEM